MKKSDELQLFQEKKIRSHWSDLKKKLQMMGSQLSEGIGQLKMQSSDGKYTKGILRLIQSIPSKNAESFMPCPFRNSIRLLNLHD